MKEGVPRMLLRAENINISFRTPLGIARVVENMSFKLDRGESLAIVGESGSGKTSVLKTILGVLPPNALVSGKLLFEGRNILGNKKELIKLRGTKIAYIPQEPMVAFNPFYSIKEHFIDRLMLTGKEKMGLLKYYNMRRKAPKDLVDRILEILTKVKVPDPKRVLESYPIQLSGGMLQRVLIGLAVATNPSLLLADEPTTALDVVTQKEILDLLKSLQESLKLSIIYVTHDLGVAKMISDKTIVMYAGHVVEKGATDEVLTEPLHPYTKGLVDAIPKLVGGELKGMEGELVDYINPPSGCRFHPRCPHATEKCKREKPPEINMGNGRVVSCWLYA